MRTVLHLAAALPKEKASRFVTRGTINTDAHSPHSIHNVLEARKVHLNVMMNRNIQRTLQRAYQNICTSLIRRVHFRKPSVVCHHHAKVTRNRHGGHRVVLRIHANHNQRVSAHSRIRFFCSHALKVFIGGICTRTRVGANKQVVLKAVARRRQRGCHNRHSRHFV